MFTSLSDRLAATFKNLRTKGRLSESDVNQPVRDIRLALLDADVALPVVKDFTHAVRELVDDLGWKVWYCDSTAVILRGRADLARANAQGDSVLSSCSSPHPSTK